MTAANPEDTPLQFRILFHQFLFRLMDVELLSASAHGDAGELLGQFGSLLVAISLLSSWCSISIGAGMSRVGLPGPIWQTERFLVSLTMLVVGIFAVLNWDATFLDRRDVLVLAPLPVRGRTLLVAKVAAAASALGVTVAALNSLSGFAWPMVLSRPGSGLVGMLRFIAAFWITFLAAGTFLYCAVLGVQALAAQLPRRWYLRVSSFLQLGGFMLFLGVLCLQPSFNSAKALAAPQNQAALAWLPSYWFMGLLSELSGAFAAEGHAVMAPLARRAMAGVGVAIVTAGGAFLLSYFRTLRKIVEEPDIVPGARGGVWLPPFGTSPQTALAQFVIRTLLRSRQHRVILAFYLGGGFAIVAVYLSGARQAMHVTGVDILYRVNAPMLVSTVIMLAAAWLGTRTVFSLPLDLRANWLFRVMPELANRDRLAAVRRALLALSVFPVCAASAMLLLGYWPWTRVAQHLVVLVLIGSVLADLSLKDFLKIPFTCSYLPGKTKVHMVFWLGVIPVVIGIHKFAGLEQEAMDTPMRYGAMVAVLAAGALAARRATNSTALREGAGVTFEETSPDELLELRLSN